MVTLIWPRDVTHVDWIIRFVFPDGPVKYGNERIAARCVMSVLMGRKSIAYDEMGRTTDWRRGVQVKKGGHVDAYSATKQQTDHHCATCTSVSHAMHPTQPTIDEWQILAICIITMIIQIARICLLPTLTVTVMRCEKLGTVFAKLTVVADGRTDGQYALQ